jgi:DNA-directed RNA polymerase subunit M/transcription elongation factor TFIIS
MVLPNICPKCNIGMRLTEQDDRVYLMCGVCGYKREMENITEHACQKCGYNKAIMTYIGVVIGDEQPVTLYRCVKCQHVEREGVS